MIFVHRGGRPQNAVLPAHYRSVPLWTPARRAAKVRREIPDGHAATARARVAGPLQGKPTTQPD